MNKEEIRQLIANNRLAKALEVLFLAVPTDMRNAVTSLQKQLRALEQEKRMGTISYGDETLRNNQITASALGLLEAEVQTEKPSKMPSNTSKPTSSLRTIKIFLASSSELKADRDELRLFISVENDRLHAKGIYLQLVQWEYFLDAVSSTRLQDEYNKALEACDVVLSLFFTRAGKYTQEEFEAAYKLFKETGKPLIFTYFKDGQVNMNDINDEVLSLLNFKKRLQDLGHFHTVYKNMDDLKVQFKRQLEKIIDALTEQDGQPANNSDKPTTTTIQQAEKIYNIGNIDSANFS